PHGIGIELHPFTDAEVTGARLSGLAILAVATATIHIGICLAKIELPPFFQFGRIGPPTGRHMLISPLSRGRRRCNDRPLPPFSSTARKEDPDPQHHRQLRNFHLLHNLQVLHFFSSTSLMLDSQKQTKAAPTGEIPPRIKAPT